MPKIGDRVVVEGMKVGGARREGTLTKVVGQMIQVKWSDGSETLFSPGAGSVQYLAGNSKKSGNAKAEKSEPDQRKAEKKEKKTKKKKG